MGLSEEIFVAAFNGSDFKPEAAESKNYQHWISEEDEKRCKECEYLHGKIWSLAETPEPEPPLHPNCRCEIEKMYSIKAGTATINSLDGADWTLKYEGELPEYYITEEDIKSLGWRRGRWPSNFAPEKMITKGAYENKNQHLPDAVGRTWYEADINYETGKRNAQRVLWSDDGLIFVTYDHYERFYEII